MANVDGQWNVVVKSPLGDQASVLTVVSDGGSFTGTMSGAMGSLDVEDGIVDGDTAGATGVAGATTSGSGAANQSRGTSSTSVSTPASCHHSSALAAAFRQSMVWSAPTG